MTQNKKTWTVENLGSYTSVEGLRFTRIVFTDRHGMTHPPQLLANAHVESWLINHAKKMGM